MKNKFLIASRILVGLVFIFSGFVKAVDPWGSTYKFIDYYHDAFKLDFLDFTALPFAFILSALEFITGIALVFNIFTKVFIWIAMAFMIVFTPLTLYLAIANPVHDCGCFGDAVVTTNWQTFNKNIIILAFTVFVFVFRKDFFASFSIKIQEIILSVTVILIFGFQLWNFNHLPVIDFRPYKIGTHIPDKMVIPANAPKDEYQMFMTLKDTVLNKEIEVEMQQYTKDSTYWCKSTKYKFIKQTEPKLIKRGYTPPIHDLIIKNTIGDNILDSVLNDNNYNFWLITYSIKNSNLNGLIKGNEIAHYCKGKGIKFYFITASNENDIKDVFPQIPNCILDSYTCDPITLKTIVRAHPGLVLLKKGTIINKWHYKDFPDTSELQTILKIK